MAHTINLQTTTVSTLNAREFATVESLRSAIELAQTPILLLATASELPELLSILRESDDICLDDAPEALKSFRLNRLRQSIVSAGPSKDRLDPLTQLLNRQTFVRLVHDMAQSASNERSISLITCDVDFFKRLNDEFGHAAGDEMLCKLANCLQDISGASVSIGRLGGEEFGLVYVAGNQEARTLAETLRLATQKLKTNAGASVTISLGIATARTSQRGSEILDKSTNALYAAKSNGRDCWCCIGDLETQSRASGNDIEVTGLENMARVLAERVANVITMRSRRLLTHVREEADIDGLTGCFTRRYLDRRLESEFENRTDNPLSIAFLDLDYFGQVNKSHGWTTGDKLLVEVCDTIRDHIREDDWIGRYGGEEFCIVMPNTSPEKCESILSRIREAVESSHFESAKSADHVPMTVSIGGTCAQNSDSSFSEMLDRAGEMALLAKNSGRNQVRMQSA